MGNPEIPKTFGAKIPVLYHLPAFGGSGHRNRFLYLSTFLKRRIFRAPKLSIGVDNRSITISRPRQRCLGVRYRTIFYYDDHALFCATIFECLQKRTYRRAIHLGAIAGGERQTGNTADIFAHFDQKDLGADRAVFYLFAGSL